MTTNTIRIKNTIPNKNMEYDYIEFLESDIKSISVRYDHNETIIDATVNLKSGWWYITKIEYLADLDIKKYEKNSVFMHGFVFIDGELRSIQKVKG